MIWNWYILNNTILLKQCIYLHLLYRNEQVILRYVTFNTRGQNETEDGYNNLCYFEQVKVL